MGIGESLHKVLPMNQVKGLHYASNWAFNYCKRVAHGLERKSWVQPMHNINIWALNQASNCNK